MSDQPQLRMVRPHLRDLPTLQIPEGYRLATWQLGWGKAWTEIIATSFQTPLEKFDFDRVMRADRPFAPERVLFLCHGERPVATASAWHNAHHQPQTGILHYVGVLPEHQGRRLGYVISLAAICRMVTERRTSAMLLTDDFRLPAIRTYLRLGFVPDLSHPSFALRWRDVFLKLDMAAEAERLPGSPPVDNAATAEP